MSDTPTPDPKPKPEPKPKTSADLVNEEGDREKRVRDLETKLTKQEADNAEIRLALSKLNTPSPYVPDAPTPKPKSGNVIVELLQDLGILAKG